MYLSLPMIYQPTYLLEIPITVPPSLPCSPPLNCRPTTYLLSLLTFLRTCQFPAHSLLSFSSSSSSNLPDTHVHPSSAIRGEEEQLGSCLPACLLVYLVGQLEATTWGYPAERELIPLWSSSLGKEGVEWEGAEGGERWRSSHNSSLNSLSITLFDIASVNHLSSELLSVTIFCYEHAANAYKLPYEQG